MDKSKLLGTVEGTNLLIKDLYLDLRQKVNEWSLITNQTPQARMGYIGQHLVSMVTGYPGGKSGARGYDIVLPNGEYGEIKTCYRVDQLGSCNACGAVVSAMEFECSDCHSRDIKRKDDSKWLISIRNDKELEESVEPAVYYFVLFEFEDINNPTDIIASIWEVDPKSPGFSLCMADYYLNIRANSTSKAPFNMWPYKPKFLLTHPKLIYRSVIHGDNTIDTLVFPGKGEYYEPFCFDKLSRSQISKSAIEQCFISLDKDGKYEFRDLPQNKGELCRAIQQLCEDEAISNNEFCDALAFALYEPLLAGHVEEMPANIRHFIVSTNDI